MLSPVLAFRPARVVERLPPRSAACPLSSKDLLASAAALRLTLPLVRAPSAGVARAALVAAKQLHSVLGLALPQGPAPEAWFAAVTAAADELAAGLPIFLVGEVVVAGRRDGEVEAAFKAAWRLADAGLTHLTLDLTLVPAEARAEVLEKVAAPALERGLGLDCLVEPGGAAAARPLFAALARRDAAPDMASLRCLAPEDLAAARAQVKELLALCAALAGTPVLRRGPVTSELLGSLKGSPVAGCDDGGAAAEAAVLSLPAESEPPAGTPSEGLAEAEARLGEAGRARLETRAYLEVLDFLERLGAAGSAQRLGRALARTLAEPGA
ncbi:MAG: hypothetical protein IPO09_07095 [Anaeromyxobacter sp.]|nr:hypothetical protein [Anaeromyxobacter sp.]MBL0277980.1 hypothetical protein [Anaeromyxobacter sp.]